MRIDTHNIANLARISLTEYEHVSYGKDIESILTFIDTIQSLSVLSSDTESHSIGMAPIDVVRQDQVVSRASEYAPVEIVSQAPSHEGNAVKVKKILA
jgi:aspartyl/glutamyl-tRNA(Asn/Gln) amidotransferase C subunit